MKTPNKDDVMKKREDTLLTGPMTLTSLMSKDKEDKSSDHIYLQLDTLSRDQVFVSLPIAPLWPCFRICIQFDMWTQNNETNKLQKDYKSIQQK